MGYGKVVIGVAVGMLAVAAFAGGSPEYVKFPEGYKASFSNYATMNRSSSAAVAKMYANDVAISSYKNGQPAASGSVIIMEVYKPKKNADGEPIVGADGINKIDKLAAIAVMERRTNWPGDLSADHQAGTWAFAIYNPDGTPKKNDLACAACHSPLESQDFLFSHERLADFVKG